MIYIENDTFFGPELSKRMHAAYTAAGGNAEYHLLPPFGGEGHFLIGQADAIPLWAPLAPTVLSQATRKRWPPREATPKSATGPTRAAGFPAPS